jgi:hypothetical protein
VVAGYSLVRTEGYALPLNMTLSGNITKLIAYYNAMLHDHLTVSSEEGQTYAHDHGYIYIVLL